MCKYNEVFVKKALRERGNRLPPHRHSGESRNPEAQSPEWKLRCESENAVSADTGSVCSALKFSRQGSN